MEMTLEEMERRNDRRFRALYATLIVSTGAVTPEEAVERANAIAEDLNKG